jgi:type IV pilus assembly protein PilN
LPSAARRLARWWWLSPAYLLFGSHDRFAGGAQRPAAPRDQDLDRQIEEINDLESQKQRFIARMQVIEKLQRSRSEVVHLFDEVTKTMPDGTYLTSFTQDGKKLKFEGVAQSSTRVSTFMRSISGSQWMKDPELEVVESKPGNTIGNSFVLDASQIATSGDEDDAPVKPKHAVRSGGAQ